MSTIDNLNKTESKSGKSDSKTDNKPNDPKKQCLKHIDPEMISELVGLQKLPNGDTIFISTVTLILNLQNTIDTQNVAKYIKISEKGFTKVIWGLVPENLYGVTECVTDEYILRSYYPTVKKRKRNTNKHNKNTNSEINEINNNIEQQKMKSKRKNNETNQCRIKIWSDTTKKGASVNIFNNGSVHMTGIKSAVMFENVYLKLLYALNEKKYVINNGKAIPKFYLENPIPDEYFDKVQSFQICMVNYTFYVYFKIKLVEMEILMKSLGANARLEISNHACVNVKFMYEDHHKVSIFIFQSGRINITGGRNYDEIMTAHIYILKILRDNYRRILLIPIENISMDIIKQY